MNLIFNEEAAQQLSTTATILLLDRLEHNGIIMPVYAVISADELRLGDYTKLEFYKKFHDTFIDAYQTGDFKYCLSALGQLPKLWNSQLESYYVEMLNRITYLESLPNLEDWKGIWTVENQESYSVTQAKLS